VVVLAEEGVHDGDEATRLEHQEVHPRQHPHLIRFRGGLVFEAHRLVYHSTLGLRVIKKRREAPDPGRKAALNKWLKDDAGRREGTNSPIYPRSLSNLDQSSSLYRGTSLIRKRTPL